MRAHLTILLLLVFLFALMGCDQPRTGPTITNAQIIAAKVACDEAGMKVQVHLRNSHPVSAVCVPIYVPSDQVQHP
jgi:hypothetical protein